MIELCLAIIMVVAFFVLSRVAQFALFFALATLGYALFYIFLFVAMKWTIKMWIILYGEFHPYSPADASLTIQGSLFSRFCGSVIRWVLGDKFPYDNKHPDVALSTKETNLLGRISPQIVDWVTIGTILLGFAICIVGF